MINVILYGILMFSCFVAIVTGRRTLIYASALLMPAIQVMPSPGGPPTSAPNLIVLGLIAGAIFHGRKKSVRGPAAPPGTESEKPSEGSLLRAVPTFVPAPRPTPPAVPPPPTLVRGSEIGGTVLGPGFPAGRAVAVGPGTAGGRGGGDGVGASAAGAA